MLSKILSHETCAACQICCKFDDDDLWEVPVIPDKLKPAVLKIHPQQKFIPHGDSSSTLALCKADDGLYTCTMLGENGCRLGGNKPFDCKIWPFRVMSLGDSLCITLSLVCPALKKLPLEDLIAFLDDGAAEEFFSQSASSHTPPPLQFNENIVLFPHRCVTAQDNSAPV